MLSVLNAIGGRIVVIYCEENVPGAVVVFVA